MIEVKGLTKLYGPIAAIKDVAFSVDQGEIVGFLGPNGAGKTTTMRIITGFSPATSGTARIAGYDVSTAPVEVKKRVGYLPESVPLYLEMRVRKFLQYVAEVKGVPSRERRQEIERVVERCGLGDVAGRTVRNLSKGYRQRVGLAQALVGNPPVLILDEPTVGLDPQQIIEIRGMIKALAQDHTVLLSTHILPEVAMVCRRVLIIHRGTIVAQDTMENLTGAGSASRIEVEAAGPADAVERTLRTVAGVKDVSREARGRFLVKAAGGAPVREEVAKALVQADLGLRGIEQRMRTLEDVFVEAISTEREGGA